MPVRHLVYTNVPGVGGTDYRTLLAPVGWAAPADAERVGRWLAEVGLRRVSVERPGWGAASFRVGSALHAAVAVVRPGWDRDVYGRAGAVLVQAALTPVSEETDDGASVHSIPLVELLAAITPDPRDGVEACLRACEAVPEWNGGVPTPLAIVPTLDRAHLAEFLRAAVRCDIAWSAAAGAEQAAAGALARAGAALPPRLRLGLRWSVGLADAGPTAEAGIGTSAPPAPPGAAELYRSWLERALRAEADAELAAVLHDWSIRSWTQLVNRVDFYG